MPGQLIGIHDGSFRSVQRNLVAERPTNPKQHTADLERQSPSPGERPVRFRVPLLEPGEHLEGPIGVERVEVPAFRSSRVFASPIAKRESFSIWSRITLMCRLITSD